MWHGDGQLSDIFKQLVQAGRGGMRAHAGTPEVIGFTDLLHAALLLRFVRCTAANNMGYTLHVHDIHVES